MAASSLTISTDLSGNAYQESQVDLSVIVAAYNEQPIIRKTIERIIAELRTRPDIIWEVICVNDGSKDLTGVFLDELAQVNPCMRVVHHRRNFGQGRALRSAFAVARGQYLVTMDADLSYGPEYIYRLVDALVQQNVEIALASPYISGGVVRNVPFYRHFLSRIGNLYLARMSNYHISTSTCVVRAYRSDAIDQMILTSDGMELQLEILMKAYNHGFRVFEVPARLEWTAEKADEADYRRVSKMKIANTIRLYLMLGWLQRPTVLFLIFSWLLIIPGAYMAVAVAARFFIYLNQHLSSGLFEALSLSLREVVQNYSHSVIFAVVFLLLGIQTLAFSLIILQNKYYYEDFSRLLEAALNKSESDVRVLNRTASD